MLRRRERKYLSAAHSELFNETESGELSANIRHYQELHKHQSTVSTEEATEDEEGKEQLLNIEKEMTEARLKGHEYDCES